MCQEKIQIAPSPASCAFDELEILGAEGYRSQCAEIIGKPLYELIVKLELAFAAAPVQFHIMRAGADNPSTHKPAGPAVAYHHGTTHTTKGAECGEQVQGFKNVGLALPVATKQQVKARPEVGVQPAVVSKIPQSQMPQMHGALWGLGR